MKISTLRLPRGEWQCVEKTLQACARGDDTANISVALRLVLQGERVPYSLIALLRLGLRPATTP